MADPVDPMIAAVIGIVLALPWADEVILPPPTTTTMTVVARLEAIALVAMTTAVVPLRLVTSMIVAIGMDVRLLAAFPLMISAPLVLVTMQTRMSLVAPLLVATMTPTPTVTVAARLMTLARRLPVVVVVAVAVAVAAVVAHALPVAVPHTRAITLPADVTRIIVPTTSKGRKFPPFGKRRMKIATTVSARLRVSQRMVKHSRYQHGLAQF